MINSMIRWLLSLGVLSLIAVVAFNNCSSGGFQSPGLSLASLEGGSAQCRTKMINSAKSELFVPALCEEMDFYRCDVRRFRPGVAAGQIVGTSCVSLAGVGDLCVPVTTYQFDTQAQQQAAEARDLVEGGAYNRDEVHCYHTQIMDQTVPLVQAEGLTVAEALERSLEICRQRSRQ